MAPSLDRYPKTLDYGVAPPVMSPTELDWDDSDDATQVLPARCEIVDDPTDVDPPPLTRSSRPPGSAQVTVRTLVFTDRVDPRGTSTWSKIATVLAALALAASVGSAIGSESRAGRADIYSSTPVEPAGSEILEGTPQPSAVSSAEPVIATAPAGGASVPAKVRPRPPTPPAASASTTTGQPAMRSVDAELGLLSDVESEPGTVRLDSSPAAKVLLDGRPLGNTPIAATRAAAGVHTVTFIHPDLGKKTIAVHVHAGEASAASVSFP